MRDLEERGIDYPKSLQKEWEEDALSDRVTLCHPESHTAVLSPPVAAGRHMDENRVNTSPTVSFNTEQKRLFQEPGIRDAMGAGWILPLHESLDLHIEDNDVEVHSKQIDEKIRDFSTWKSSKTGIVHPVVMVRSYWVPDVEDGTSLLITQPHFLDPEEYTVLTTLVDADKIPKYIDVPVMLHGRNRLSMHKNRPLAQVIPIRRSLLRADTEIVPPTSD